MYLDGFGTKGRVKKAREHSIPQIRKKCLSAVFSELSEPVIDGITWQDVSETYDCWMTDYRVLLPQAMPLPCLEKIYRSGSSPARYENHPCCWKQKIHPKALCPLSSNKAFVFVFGHIDTNRNNHPPNPPTINLRCWLYRTLYLVAAFHINRPSGISLINNTVKSCGWSFIETVLR